MGRKAASLGGLVWRTSRVVREGAAIAGNRSADALVEHPFASRTRMKKAQRETRAADLQAKAERDRAEIRAGVRTASELKAQAEHQARSPATLTRGDSGLAHAIERALRTGCGKACAPIRPASSVLSLQDGSLPRYKGLTSPIETAVRRQRASASSTNYPHTEIALWVRGREAYCWMPDLPAAIETDIDKLVESCVIGLLEEPRDRWTTYLGKRALAQVKSELGSEMQSELQSDRGKRRFEVMRAKKAAQTNSSHQKVVDRAQMLIQAGTPRSKLVAETTRKNPGYSSRQIRRILTEAEILRPK